MDWRKRLHLTNSIISDEVDAYLKQNNFYEDKMSPRFMNEESFFSKIKNHDAPCLRLDVEDPRCHSSTMRIFVANDEIYMEVQNDFRSYERSWYVDVSGGVTIDNIDKILNEVTKM